MRGSSFSCWQEARCIEDVQSERDDEPGQAVEPAEDHGAVLLDAILGVGMHRHERDNLDRRARALISDLASERQARAEAEARVEELGAEAAAWKERAERARACLSGHDHLRQCDSRIGLPCDCGRSAALADDPPKEEK